MYPAVGVGSGGSSCRAGQRKSAAARPRQSIAIRPEQRRCVRDSADLRATAAEPAPARPEKLEIIPNRDCLPLAATLCTEPDCEYPSCFPYPQLHKEGEIDLGAWTYNRRRDYKKRSLPADRIAALESIAGWMWLIYKSEQDP